MEILLIIIGFILALVGLAGCIVPFVPGPPLSYAALLVLSLAKGWEPFTTKFLIIWAAITVFVSLSDNIAPMLGAQKYGASKQGIWLGVLGMLVGLIFFPPWGLVLGAFLGTFFGELLAGKQGMHAVKSSWGVFVGTMMGITLKLAASGVMLFYFVKGLF